MSEQEHFEFLFVKAKLANLAAVDASNAVYDFSMKACKDAKNAEDAQVADRNIIRFRYWSEQNRDIITKMCDIIVKENLRYLKNTFSNRAREIGKMALVYFFDPEIEQNKDE